MSFVVRPHLPFSHLRIKQLHLEGIARNTINDQWQQQFLYTEHLLFTHYAECWKMLWFSFKTTTKGRNLATKFYSKKFYLWEVVLTTAPYFSRKKTGTRVKEKAKVRRGWKAEKADTFQRGLCHIHAKSAEMIILPLSRAYGSVCLEFC